MLPSPFRNRALVVLFAALLLTVHAPRSRAADPAPATGSAPSRATQPPPPGLWRTRVVRGGWTYAWGDGVRGPWTLIDADGGAIPVKAGSLLAFATWIDAIFQTKLSLDAPPGEYTLRCGAEDVSRVTITADPPARPWVDVTPAGVEAPAGSDARAIQAALDRGANVRLQPGEYRLDRVVTLRRGATLRGAGRDAVTLVREPNGDYAQRAFAPAEGATVSDLTLRLPGYAFWGKEPAGNMAVERVRFVGGQLGEWSRRGLLVADCLFERCAANQVTDRVMFLRCRFEGLGGDHAWSCWGGREIAMIECEFRGTDRGLVFQGHRGKVERCLFTRLRLSDIDAVDNGNEVILIEGGEFNHNLFQHIRVKGCEGAGVQFWLCKARGNAFLDVVLDGGTGIWFHQASPEHVQTGNVFQWLEVRGGGVRFENATENLVCDAAFVCPRPTRGNQQQTPQAMFSTPQKVISATGAGNRVERTTLWDLNGATAVDGCLVNGVRLQ